MTAIHGAAGDGNPHTDPDGSWQPFLITPPVPDYPATHTVLGWAAAEVLIELFGDRMRYEEISSSSHMRSGSPPEQRRLAGRGGIGARRLSGSIPPSRPVQGHAEREARAEQTPFLTAPAGEARRLRRDSA